MKLMDYTEKSNVVDHTKFYNLHIDTPAVKKAVNQRNSSFCPFCSNKLNLVFHFTKHVSATISPMEWMLVKTVASIRDLSIPKEFEDNFFTYSCNNCGWWRVENHQKYLQTIDYIFPTLRSFSVDSKKLPLNILWTELLKKPDMLHSVNDQVFEKFVGSVMSSILDVRVTHVGKTKDGGVDLFYCEGVDKFAIQVKRKMKSTATEGVALVREFLGAMMLEDYSGGVIVSTADHFTSGAKEKSITSIKKGLVSKFNLIDKKEFLHKFEFNPERAKSPWEHVFIDEAKTIKYDYPYKLIVNKSRFVNDKPANPVDTTMNNL